MTSFVDFQASSNVLLPDEAVFFLFFWLALFLFFCRIEDVCTICKGKEVLNDNTRFLTSSCTHNYSGPG